MLPTSALDIAESQFDYAFAQLASSLTTLDPTPWLLLTAVLALLAFLVHRKRARGANSYVICPRDHAPARVELTLVEGIPGIDDCSRWSSSGRCTGACRHQLTIP